MDYYSFYREESNTYGINLQVAGILDDKNISSSVKSSVYTKIREAKEILLAEYYRTDLRTIEHKEKQRAELIGLFPSSIFVEEIPNGYQPSDSYFQHLPWFKVTTIIGRIKIGWRKRVISIDWSETVVKKSSFELFPDEEVTRSAWEIHAWSLLKAKEYIQKIMKIMESK